MLKLCLLRQMTKRFVYFILMLADSFFNGCNEVAMMVSSCKVTKFQGENKIISG